MPGGAAHDPHQETSRRRDGRRRRRRTKTAALEANASCRDREPARASGRNPDRISEPLPHHKARVGDGLGHSTGLRHREPGPAARCVSLVGGAATCGPCVSSARRSAEAAGPRARGTAALPSHRASREGAGLPPRARTRIGHPLGSRPRAVRQGSPACLRRARRGGARESTPRGGAGGAIDFLFVDRRISGELDGPSTGKTVGRRNGDNLKVILVSCRAMRHGASGGPSSATPAFWQKRSRSGYGRGGEARVARLSVNAIYGVIEQNCEHRFQM